VERDSLAELDVLAATRDARIRPEFRARRGVVHTPARLAQHVVRLLDALVRDSGLLGTGISSTGVTLIDPAIGPGVFLAAGVDRGGAAPAACVGIDVDPDAVALAEGGLRPRFEARGWPLELRVGDALTTVPRVDGVAVVVGNPPWTARTESRGVTDALLDDFRRDPDGQPLHERKIGVLSDAYVRFFRWALAVVERASGGGAIALVTNASFLDGPVHRGMRAYARQALDRIELVDLGGSALVARAGRRDENLFGVRPGVVLTLGVRRPGEHARRAAIRSARLRGSKEEKLVALETLGLEDPRWTPLDPAPPLARWVPPAPTRLPERWPSIDAWMPFEREGVQTNRDELCVAPTREALRAQLEAFVTAPSPALARAHFDPARAAAQLARDRAEWNRWMAPIAYRPLDERWLFSHPAVCHRARPELAAALAHAPLALVVTRKDRGERPFAHFGVVRAIADNCWLSSRSSCRARVVPVRTPEGAPNIGEAVRAPLEAVVGAVSAEDVLAYLLAWLAAPSYRARFDAALHEAPARVPLPLSAEAWRAIVEAGRRILHAFEADRHAPSDAALVLGHRDVLAELGDRATERQRAQAAAVAEAIAAADAPIARAMHLFLGDLVVSPT
jgi:predicted helicase